MTDYMPKREDGLMPYVVVKRSVWDAGKNVRGSLFWAANLREAKRLYGWTRQMHTTVTVRRARLIDADLPSGVSS